MVKPYFHIHFNYFVLLIGEPSLKIRWTRPNKKHPEDGYKVVVVPYADSTIHVPKIYFVPTEAEHQELIVNGAEFDPFIDYSVSVIARHNPESLEHESPNGREFAARVFTGEIKKNKVSKFDSSVIGGVGNGFREVFVSPNACCGYTLYNTEEMTCCGGKLFDPSRKNGMIECCGTEVYDRSRFQCCNPILKPPVIKTIIEGCGFGHVDGVIHQKQPDIKTEAEKFGFRELKEENNKNPETTIKPTTITLFKYTTTPVQVQVAQNSPAGKKKSKNKAKKSESRRIKKLQKQKRRQKKQQNKRKNNTKRTDL